MEKKETKNKPETTHTHTHTDDPTREVKGKAKKNRAQGLFANRCLYKRFIGSKNETGNPLPPPTSIPEIEEEEEEEEEEKKTQKQRQNQSSPETGGTTLVSLVSLLFIPRFYHGTLFFSFSPPFSHHFLYARARA